MRDVFYDDGFDPRNDCGLQDSIDRDDEYVRRIPLPDFQERDEEVEEPEQEQPDGEYGFPELHKAPAVYRKPKKRKKTR